MSTTEREPIQQTPEQQAAVANTPDAAATQGVSAGPAVQPPAKTAEKELLCTICNLRACWEAPAETPAATP
jgi:hypothetical protein